MEPSLELFDQHVDEVFAYFSSRARTREEALAATEEFFSSLMQQPIKNISVPGKIPYFARYIWLSRRLMKVSS